MPASHARAHNVGSRYTSPGDTGWRALAGDPDELVSFSLLLLLVSVLWLAGGASRASVSGQTIVRAVAWTTLVIATLAARRPRLAEVRPVVLILIVAILLPVLQLVPLPPEAWRALPSRGFVEEAEALSGSAEAWRPWSLVPAATGNALSSLVVPVAVLLLLRGLADRQRSWVFRIVLCAIVASLALGLIQFSGIVIANPLVNETLGDVTGTFANRNHFALFLAFGCLLVPAWAFGEDGRTSWRLPAGAGLLLLLLLTILAIGSRAGLLMAVVGMALGWAIVDRDARRLLARRSRRGSTAILAGAGVVLAAIVVASIHAGRAMTVTRLVDLDPVQDMRRRGFPVVWAMVREYFPAGSGLGGFDPVFRMHEPFGLLKLTFFNHAHNDYLEIALDAGLPGVLLLAVAIGWWGRASWRAWRHGRGAGDALPRLGSAILLMTLIASVFDYPARTPMMMAIVVIAAVWLADRSASGRPVPRGRDRAAWASALPPSVQRL